MNMGARERKPLNELERGVEPCEEHNESVLGIGQATKGAWRMPRHRQPKKDVDSCEKLRGAANRL